MIYCISFGLMTPTSLVQSPANGQRAFVFKICSGNFYILQILILFFYNTFIHLFMCLADVNVKACIMFFFFKKTAPSQTFLYWLRFTFSPSVCSRSFSTLTATHCRLWPNRIFNQCLPDCYK